MADLRAHHQSLDRALNTFNSGKARLYDQAGRPIYSAEQMQQAVTIIRQRVDASGVGEAEVTTQAGNQIVVQIPGQADEETRNRIEASAQLQLRAVLYAGDPATRRSRSWTRACVALEPSSGVRDDFAVCSHDVDAFLVGTLAQPAAAIDVVIAATPRFVHVRRRVLDFTEHRHFLAFIRNQELVPAL